MTTKQRPPKKPWTQRMMYEPQVRLFQPSQRQQPKDIESAATEWLNAKTIDTKQAIFNQRLGYAIMIAGCLPLIIVLLLVLSAHH